MPAPRPRLISFVMELHRRRLSSQLLDPAHGFEPAQRTVEIRRDPLTGHSARLVAGGGRLMPPSDFDLAALASSVQPSCPFCEERFEQQTPRFSPAICAHGRIRHGDAVGFPNLLAYAQYSSVCIYSPRLHYLPLEKMSASLVKDNIACQVDFARAVTQADPEAEWASINANHMLPSGSSVFHPHTQASVDPEPSTFQRLLAAVPAHNFRDYLAHERQAGERYLGSTGSIDWLASFAPVGPCELTAFTFAARSPAQLESDLIEELSSGVATALNLYAELGFQSFNMAIYGASPSCFGFPVTVRLVSRSNLTDLYRCDATYLERLHWEAAVELSPEDLAQRAGDRFAS